MKTKQETKLKEKKTELVSASSSLQELEGGIE